MFWQQLYRNIFRMLVAMLKKKKNLVWQPLTRSLILIAADSYQIAPQPVASDVASQQRGDRGKDARLPAKHLPGRVFIHWLSQTAASRTLRVNRPGPLPSFSPWVGGALRLSCFLQFKSLHLSQGSEVSAELARTSLEGVFNAARCIKENQRWQRFNWCSLRVRTHRRFQEGSAENSLVDHIYTLHAQHISSIGV